MAPGSVSEIFSMTLSQGQSLTGHDHENLMNAASASSQLPECVGLSPPLRRRRPGNLLQLDAAGRGRRRLAGIQVGHLKGKTTRWE